MPHTELPWLRLEVRDARGKDTDHTIPLEQPCQSGCGGDLADCPDCRGTGRILTTNGVAIQGLVARYVLR